MTWRDAAACRGHDTALWYPERWDGLAEHAVSICMACPVRQECLAEALANGEQGVWGGLSERRRHGLGHGRNENCCVICGRWFDARYARARTCGAACRQRLYRQNQREAS